MATFTLGNGLANQAWIGNFFDYSFSLNSSSATAAELLDSSGSRLVIAGSDLTFSGNTITGGTITEIDFIDGDDNILVKITNAAFTAADMNASNFDDLLSNLTQGNDTFIGNTSGSDIFAGANHGDDTITVISGGGFIHGSEGEDTIIGGADENWDTLSYEDTFWQNDAFKGVTLNAATGIAKDSWGDRDVFSNIEEYRGSIFDDRFTGSGRHDVFAGMKGADSFNGAGGRGDVVLYHYDVNFGGTKGIVANLATGTIIDGFGNTDSVKSIEWVFGTYQNDIFIGDETDNGFRGLSGIDSFDGGKGFDRIQFDWWEDLGQSGVNVDLSLKSGQIINDGFGNSETIRRIEAVDGSQFDDTIRMGKSHGVANGLNGDDVLIASGLSLGGPSHFLFGGNGADIFKFMPLENDDWTLPKQIGIGDFSTTDGDKIDLSEIGGLTFIGTRDFDGVAGQVRLYLNEWSSSIVAAVLVDRDGDREVDLHVSLVGNVELTSADLII